jgi:hypothetical protein
MHTAKANLIAAALTLSLAAVGATIGVALGAAMPQPHFRPGCSLHRHYALAGKVEWDIVKCPVERR